MEKKSFVPKYESFVDRYFKRKYFMNKTKPGEDVCVLSHSNKVCVLTLSPNHPVLKAGKTVKRVAWKFGTINRLSNRVIGKGKKGGQSLSAGSLLCEIQCDDGSVHQIPAGVKSQLLEINDNLITNPQLLTQKPQEEGYIAIIQPKKKEFEEEMKKLTSEEDYNKLFSSDTNT